MSNNPVGDNLPADGQAAPRAPDDLLRVQLTEDWEIDYWCRQFFCTPEQLRAAVATVGVMAADVHGHLRQH